MVGCRVASDKEWRDDMDMKYYIAILCAVTVVVGSLVGTYASAEDNADIAEITKTVSMEKLAEMMEAKGFDVTVEDDVISAYKEEYGRTVQITFDCPDGQCQFAKPKPPEGWKPCDGMKKRHFRFKMHGTMTIEAIREKMAGMGYDVEDIEAKINWMQENEKEGYSGCPMQEVIEQE